MLKSQDLIILVDLALRRDPQLQQKSIAAALGLSQAEISFSLRRSADSFLYEPADKRVIVANLMELLVHAIKYLFPVTLGGLTRGVPTAWGITPLKQKIITNEIPVWPHAEGTASGPAVTPLHEIVPAAALKNKNLHEALALVDTLRIGKVRERELATGELLKRFGYES